MRKIIFISFCIILFFAVADAQQKNDAYQDTAVIDTAFTAADIEVAPTDTIYVDTTLYYNRLTISPDSIENWKNLNSFAYVKNLDSLLKAKQEAEKKKEKEVSSSGTGWFENLLSSGGFQLMLWILAVLFILFILYKLFLTEGAFRKNSKNLNSFAYVKNLDSLLKAKQEAEKKKEKEVSSSGQDWFESLLSSDGLQLILWMLAAFFILFILYKLFLTEGVFRKNPRNSKSLTPEAEEEIINDQSNFEQLIKQALQSGNYRLAVRYNYLKTIHKLADKGLILLAADKTNYQYVNEISNPNYQNDFAALTLNYEYVWYGEFVIGENIYTRMETGFSQFNSKL
ncbi:MAG: hypothetical protein RIS73_205 [Bacteroidota bacterium]